MSEAPTDAQARIYQERAQEYDALVSAEDADGELERALLAAASFEDAMVADVGAGTGRITRLLGSLPSCVHLIDRASPMLEVAKRRLASAAGPSSVTHHFHAADVRELPLESGSVDVAVAGWVFGHFRHWMPDGWRDEVRAALEEMERVVRPGGQLMVIETLGTGHETPRQGHALDVYFDYLEMERGMERTWVRTDYQFPDVASAAAICGPFFGDELVGRIQENGWARVPECTALFTSKVR